MRTLSPKGIVLGGIVDIVATNVVSFPILVVAAARADVASLTRAEQTKALLDAMHASPGLQGSAWALGALCSVLGGYVAARLARRGEVVNGALSAFLCVSLGVYALVAGHDATTPLWQHIVGLVGSPALGALGGYLRLRQTSRPDDPTLAAPLAA